MLFSKNIKPKKVIYAHSKFRVILIFFSLMFDTILNFIIPKSFYSSYQTRSQSWEFGSQEVVSSTRRPRRLLIIKRVKFNWVDIYWGRTREIGWRFKEEKGKERRDNNFFLGVKIFFLFIYFKIMWHVLIRLKDFFYFIYFD